MRPSVPHTLWTTSHVAAIDESSAQTIGLIGQSDRLLPDHYLWDMWPVQLADGATADIAGGILWMILSSVICADSDARHGVARIRLLHQSARSGAWRDLGNLLPDGFNPGSREWAGSAILAADGTTLTLYFTATGCAGEATLSFGQRLYETQAQLVIDDSLPVLTGWTAPRECVANDGVHYMQIDETQGAPGTIKAFRDPAWFRDPLDGVDYLVFAASMPSGSSHNGAVGIAVADPDAPGGWQLRAPLLSADGVNNELERPHVVARGGYYYLFWSTHQFTFADAETAGPTGLYGMVAESLFGPYTPLNGTGLVAANPVAAPDQAYSWLVLDDLRVASFIDSPHGETFSGTPAPMFSLKLEGQTTQLIEAVYA